MSEAVLVFAREPAAGRAKTRLIPLLGERGAAELYARLLAHTLREVAAIDRPELWRVACLEPPEALARAREFLPEGFDVIAQACGDLGAKLVGAFATAFERGAERAIALGTDCLDLTRERIAAALASLEEHDAVLGPALDGGYYLLGLSRRLAPDLERVFAKIPWSTEHTLDAQRAALRRVGVEPSLLEPLRDLDTPEDCAALRERWRGVVS